VYLNDDGIKAKNASRQEVIQFIIGILRGKDFVTDAFATADIVTHPITAVVKEKFLKEGIPIIYETRYFCDFNICEMLFHSL
jgi:hypothetical protein